MESISQKVSTILDTYYNQDGSIICDNGQGNVIMIDGSPLQFDFVDTQETDSRTEIEDDKSDAGTIIQEIQSGYMLGDRLLRPALVGVTKRKNSKNDEKKDKKEEK